jgi:WD40 repeat protein/DNA-binding SARP family transcriptional activator
MFHLVLSLLGGFQAAIDDHPLTGFESNKVRALLAYLAVEAGHPYRRESLAALLWPEFPETIALANLRVALADLRNQIHDREADLPFLLIDRESIQLNPDADVWVDVWEFDPASRDQGAAIRAQRLAARDPQSSILNQQSTIINLQSTISLYRGPFLDGFSIPGSIPFEEWLILKRERFHQQALRLLCQLAEFYESCGEYEQALMYARRQVELEPWLEEAHRQIMRLLALSERGSQALAQYEACKLTLANELGIEPAAETTRLYETIRLGRLEDIRPGELLPFPGEPPYKGLWYFDVPDAGLFFGREHLSARLVEHMREMVAGETGEAHYSDPCRSVDDEAGSLLPLPQFLVVVGASGSGKSSVVRAGLVPALQQGGWQVEVITPTAHPLEVLSETVNKGEKRILVIDQFEELFTLCRSEEERTEFLDRLLTPSPERCSLPPLPHLNADTEHRSTNGGARLPSPNPLLIWGGAGGGAGVVLVLRADFYGHCAQYPRLRQALCASQEFIGPMSAAELRRAIEQPAMINGWELEPGLVDLILRDVGASEDHPPEPGALPLLEHALLETWQRRRGRILTLKGYAEAGGVHGAIAKTAESVFTRLTPEQQALARRIFLRLTELGESTQDTRRRAPLNELTPAGEDASQVSALLQALAQARLITLAEDTAEVAHEALIREWPALREWLSEDREGLRQHRHLTDSAENWVELERDREELYRGVRLAQAVEWAESHPHDLNVLEYEFLQASQAQAQREAVEREAQRLRELEAARRLARTQRQRSLVLSVGLAIAVILIGVALWLNYRANTNLGMAQDARQTAQAEAKIRATHQALAEFAQGTAQVEAMKSSTLQVLAENQSLLARSRELAAAAVNSLSNNHQLSLLLAIEAYNVTPSGEAESALRQIVQTTHSEETLEVPQSAGLKAVAYSPDGHLLAVINDTYHLLVFDPEQGSQPLPLDYLMMSDEPEEVEFFPDGRLVVRGKYQFAIYDVNLSKRLMTGVAFVNGVQVVDRVENKPILELQNVDARRYPLGLGYTDRGIYLAAISTVTTTVEIAVTNLATLQPVVTISELEDINKISLIEFSPDGSWMALAHEAGEIVIWDLSANRQLYRLNGMPAGAITAMAYSPDGTHLAAAGAQNAVKVWELASGREILSAFGRAPVFSPDGQELIVSDENRYVNVWDIANRLRLYSFLCHPGQTNLALRPDGQQVASVGTDRIAHLCDVYPGSGVRAWALGLPLKDIDYSPVQGLLGIASVDNMVRIYAAETGELRQSVRLPGEKRLERFAFFRDGARFATIETGSTNMLPHTSLRIWETATGKELLHNIASGDEVLFQVSPDGSRIFYQALSDNGWEYDSANLAFVSYYYYEDQNTLVAYSPDSAYLALADPGGAISIYRSPSGEWMQDLDNTYTDYLTMAYHPDGIHLALATQIGGVEIWNTRVNEVVTSLQGEFAPVNALAYSPDGQLLATGSRDGMVRVWQADTSFEIMQLSQHEAGVIFLAFTQDGKRLLSVDEVGVVRTTVIPMENILEIARHRLRRGFTDEELLRYHLTSLAPARQADSSALASLPLETPEPIPALTLVPPQPVRPASQVISLENYPQMVELGSARTGFGQDLAFAPDGQSIAVASSIGLSLFDTATLREIWRQKNEAVMLGVIFSPDGAWLATGGEDGHVRVWRAADGAEVRALEGHSQWVTSAAFSPDGRLLASSSLDDAIHLWRTSDWTLQARLVNTPPGNGVAAIQFTPDGDQLAALSNDYALRFWDLASQQVVRTIPEIDPRMPYKSPEILSVANSNGTWFLPDTTGPWGWFGKIQSYSSDGTFLTDFFICEGVIGTVCPSRAGLTFWSIADNDFKPVPLSFSFWIMGAQAFSPDGKLLALCSLDGYLRLWGVP